MPSNLEKYYLSLSSTDKGRTNWFKWSEYYLWNRTQRVGWTKMTATLFLDNLWRG